MPVKCENIRAGRLKMICSHSILFINRSLAIYLWKAHWSNTFLVAAIGIWFFLRTPHCRNMNMSMQFSLDLSCEATNLFASSINRFCVAIDVVTDYFLYMTCRNIRDLKSQLRKILISYFRYFHLQALGCRAGLNFLPAKASFCHLPVLTGFNQQKVSIEAKYIMSF